MSVGSRYLLFHWHENTCSNYFPPSKNYPGALRFETTVLFIPVMEFGKCQQVARLCSAGISEGLDLGMGGQPASWFTPVPGLADRRPPGGLCPSSWGFSTAPWGFLTAWLRGSGGTVPGAGRSRGRCPPQLPPLPPVAQQHLCLMRRRRDFGRCWDARAGPWALLLQRARGHRGHHASWSPGPRAQHTCRFTAGLAHQRLPRRESTLFSFRRDFQERRELGHGVPPGCELTRPQGWGVLRHQSWA